MAKRIEAGWLEYKKTIPANAHSVQVTETRRAFYAGAVIIFQALVNGVSAGPDPQNEDLRMMADMQAEIDAFLREIRVAIAKEN